MIFKSGAKYGVNPHQFFFLNPQDGEILHKFDIPYDVPAVVTFEYSPEGRWFAYRAWEERRIEVVDTTHWEVRKPFKVRGGNISDESIAFSPDVRYLGLGDTVLDFQTGGLVHVGEGMTNSRFLNDTHLLIKEEA